MGAMKITSGALSIGAPAKINLTLCIGRRRPDGFHDLESLFQAVGVYDQVTLEGTDDGEIRVTASDARIPCDERNTAFRAARLLRDRHAAGRGVRIHLEKRIPSEAGLGGGSSDAAAVLRGLNRLWALELPAGELAELGAGVGSDVPFFVYGGCALVRGRGEQVEPLAGSAFGWVVLVKPAFGVSTARAYAELAARRAGAPPPDCAPATAAMRAALESGSAAAVGRALVNDLEAPAAAMHPEIEQLKQELLDAGATGALLSGSGSTVFGVFATEEGARQAAERLGVRWPWVLAVPPVAAAVERERIA